MKIFSFLLLLSASIAVAQSPSNGALEVVVTNIAAEEGKIMIGLYAIEKKWLKDSYKGAFGKISNGAAKVVFEQLPYGSYAVSVFHDKNDNNELDMRFGFLPKEPTASSNQAPSRFGPPRWEDAKFELNTNKKKITIKL